MAAEDGNGPTAGTATRQVALAVQEVLVLGAEAAELIHVFVALVRAGATARALVDAEMVHPTFAEGLQSLAMRLPRYALK